MIQRTHPAMKLMDSIECLFASGADESTGEDELLALLDGLRWRLMIHAILHQAEKLYEYTVEGPLRYRGAELLAESESALRLYQQTQPAQSANGVCYQRSLELWVSEEMDLFVTSCFRVSSGATTTEYRNWLSQDWLDTELEIDFPALAGNLKMLCELADENNIPFYEVGCV